MNKFVQGLKDLVTTEEEIDEEEVEEVAATSDYEQPAQKNILKTDAKMMIFEPRSYNDATEIVKYLKVQKACVVNIHRLQNEIRQRLIDVLWGAVYAIDGKIQKVGTDVYLCTPRSVTVDGMVGGPEAESEE
ncbi:MAG: cell division protein SepF [Erysipelotrichaceae bacterium]|nr:cell division protein SepF [Erysipelotrichaceae bacterium]MBQ1304330.1 cell division protein SepF [Erysipelotrichaceae bacterium]